MDSHPSSNCTNWPCDTWHAHDTHLKKVDWRGEGDREDTTEDVCVCVCGGGVTFNIKADLPSPPRALYTHIGVYRTG